MGMILWEDSIQQALRLIHGDVQQTLAKSAEDLRREMAAQLRTSDLTRGAHTRYASRRSAYFLHTRSGKRQASRPLERAAP